MESSWLAPAKGKYNAMSRTEVNEGTRPSGEALMAMIDTADPAFMHIVAALQEFKEAGIDLTEASVAMAIQLGRKRRTAAEIIPRRPRIGITRPSEVVYYIRRGSVIKIGTTNEPRTRFSALLPDEILATEPGGRALEQQRHAEFNSLRIGRSEYFRMEPALLAHVQTTRGSHGDPDPTWPTMGSIGTAIHFDWTRLPMADNAEVATIPTGARTLGLNYHTIYGWVRRRRLITVGKDCKGSALYFVDHMAILAARSRARSA